MRHARWVAGWLLVFTAALSLAAPEPEKTPKLKNTLRWSTASEVDNFGFDVYRGPSEDGPFKRLTEKPIAGSGTSDLPSRYVYHDTSIEPGREYFYYVESISMSGARERFTPVLRAAPKSLAEPKHEDETPEQP